MNSIPSIALSGLQVASRQMAASAQNIANLATEGYRRMEVVSSPVQGGGVRATMRQAAEPGENLLADVVSQMQGEYMFKANLQSIRTYDRLLGVLIDTRA